MTPPTHLSKAYNRDEVPAIIRTVTRESVLWDKPVFRPPPLDIQVPIPEFAEFTAGSRGRDSAR